MRKRMHKQPSFHISLPTIKQNLQLNAEKKPSTLLFLRTLRQHHISQHAIVQKPTAYSVKIKTKGDQKPPRTSLKY